MVVFESDPGGVTPDADDAGDSFARLANGSLVITCKDSLPQFGKDDVDVIRFASLRFDHALDENDRSAVTHALASHDAIVSSWQIAAGYTYAFVRCGARCTSSELGEIAARVDDPALVVLRVRPLFVPAIARLHFALGGAGRPRSVRGVRASQDELIVELEPSGKAIFLTLALIDATLAATPGRTIEPVLPLSDGVLAEYASLRLHDAEIDVSRVLDVHVEHLLEAAGA